MKKKQKRENLEDDDIGWGKFCESASFDKNLYNWVNST